MENFALVPNIYHKGKGDSVDNKGGRKQIMIVGVDNKRGRVCDVDSRAKEEKGRVASAVAIT